MANAAQGTLRLQIPRKLNSSETAETLDHWIHSYTDYVSRDPILAPFLNTNWNYNAGNMGFTRPIAEVQPAQLAINCKQFLSHVNSFMANPYSRKSIEQRTTNVESIWTLLREKYNVTKSAESLLDIGNLAYDKSESYACFFEKVVYYVEMNMAPANTTVNHVTTGAEGDKLSVTLMDLCAILWMQKIDPRLFNRVRIDYSVQIKNGSRISELVPTIARALPGILKSMDGVKKEVYNIISELNIGHNEEDNNSDANTHGIYQLNSEKQFQRGGDQNRRRQNQDQRNRPQCDHCTWLKKSLKIREVDTNHSTTSCTRALPASVKSVIERGPEESSRDEASSEEGETILKMSKYNGTSFQRKPDRGKRDQPSPTKAQNKVLKQDPNNIPHQPTLSESVLRSLRIRTLRLDRKAKSPRILITFKGDKIPLLVDEGSEINCGDATYVKTKGMTIRPTQNTAKAAGDNSLTVLGVTEEDVIVDTKFNSIHVPINLGKITVVENLGVPLLMGEPGKASNSISTDPKNRVIFLEQNKRIFSKPYFEKKEKTVEVCRIEEGPTTVYPNNSVNVNIPETFIDKKVVITPRREFSQFFDPLFTTGNETIHLKNISDMPVNIGKHSHVADVREVKELDTPTHNSVNLVHFHTDDKFKFIPRAKEVEKPDIDSIKIDPDNIMPKEMKKKFYEVNKRYERVFTKTPGRYSGAFGDSDTSIRFNNRPVQTRKVSSPNYGPEMKMTLNNKMNELRQHGVLVKPEEIGVSIEHFSPCLIVPKPGTDDWRLVTDLTELNLSISRDSSVSPTIEEAKTAISQKKFFAELDLSNYFHQGGISRSDCQWLGVMHPFDGPLCYTASPQGLKNSSEQSYNRLAKIFGDMIRDNKMTRMADGLYPIANSLDELLVNYTEVLDRVERSNMTLKPAKTSIASKSAVIFGWRYQDGKWLPQDHVISSLSRAEKPTTVKQLRSFVGSIKQLAESIPRYAEMLHPLEQVIGSRGSSERLTWTKELEDAFARVKEAVKSPEGIHLPRREDRIITSSDFSKQTGAIGGKMMIVRKLDSGKEVSLLGGHFSAKVGEGRSKWLPCDGEALGVKQVLEHFQHHIRESNHECIHYTDSMPVVQAHRRLITGRFSNSSKITAFLATMATLPVRLEHRPGSSLLNEDHASRHPPPPCEGPCQICKFINDDVEIGNKLSVFTLSEEAECREIMEKDFDVPYLQLKTWLHEQRNCPVHSRIVALIRNGQEPERRKTGGLHTQVKHLHTLYKRNNLKIHSSGVVMVKTPQGHYDGFAISVPEPLFHGLCFSLHHKLQHPKKSQLVKFMSRYFFTTGLQNIVNQISDACLHCLSTVRLPKALLPETTSIPTGFGSNFSADVLERASQAIFICKEEMSQYVTTSLVEDQTTPSMRDAIITSTSPLINISGGKIKLDAAPAFQSLQASQLQDPILKELRLTIELGHSLNRNKNPQAENTVGELKRELLNLAGKNEQISASTLALATRNLNLRVRSNNKSAWENLTSRDVMTSRPFAQDDQKTLDDLRSRRAAQHEANMKSRSKTRKRIQPMKFEKGDIVMYRDVENYDAARDTFIVMEDDGKDVEIRKFKNQLRMKTYSVKREQLILIFSPSSLKTGQEENNNTMTQQDAIPLATKRRAAVQSRLKTHQMATDKIISISKIKNETDDENTDDNNYAFLDFNTNNRNNDDMMMIPNRSEDDDDDDSSDDDPFSSDSESGTNSFLSGFNFSYDDYQDDIHEDDADEHDDSNNSLEGNASPGPHLSEDTKSIPDAASQSSIYSAISRTQNTSQSLEWDDHSLTVNLSPVDDRIRLFSAQSDDFHTESSLDEVFIPNLEEPQSPTSPFLRMTRHTLRSGGFVKISESVRVSTLSSEGSLFLRTNPLRKPILKVKVKNDDIPSISDVAAHTPRLADRPPTPGPDSGPSSPQ